MKVLQSKHTNAFRAKLSAQQQYKCPLCNQPITADDSHLDHDHTTGHCRAALCPRCNRVLGVIETWQKIIRMSLPEWLTRIVKYLTTDYSDMPIYASHPQDMTKRFSRLSKAQMIELLAEIYPDMSFDKYKKAELIKLYRQSWKQHYVQDIK
ncbi:TPA: hypothetical protein NJ081_004578 [Vibrio parahaemolyticus]|nr:hypothetical protein [Vibrio parahaemolyticus]